MMLLLGPIGQLFLHASDDLGLGKSSPAVSPWSTQADIAGPEQMSSPRPLKKRGNAALGRNYNSGEAVLELLLTTGTYI